jgi:hypothetical protein
MDCGQDKYDVEPFLANLEVSRPNDYNQLIALLDRATEYGIIPNAQKTKRLHGDHAKHLWEFCAKGGARIFWFLDEQNKTIVVCTHGFLARNQHDHKNDIRKAQERKQLYYEYRRQQQLSGKRTG